MTNEQAAREDFRRLTTETLARLAPALMRMLEAAG